MIEVVEINRLEDLAGYQLLWNSLLCQTPGASFFHSHAWFEAYWRHYGRDQQMRVLVVLDDRRPLGILPLVVRREATRIGKVRVLTYPLHDWGAFYSPLGPSPANTLLAGLQHIRKTRRDWELLDLRWVQTDPLDRSRTAAAMASAGFPAQSEVWDQTVQIDLTAGWDAYWNSRNGKYRNNVRRFERRLAEQGEVTYERYRPRGSACNDGDPRWDLYDTCMALAECSWQGSSTTGTTISHTAVSGFLREAHAAAAKAGALDVNLLYIAERPAAFAYNYHSHGYVFGLRIGFDPQAARHGAGNVLYLRIIKDCCLRGDHTYDMGPGSLEAKRHLLTRIVNSERFTYFPPPAPRAQVLRLKRWWNHRRSTALEPASA